MAVWPRSLQTLMEWMQLVYQTDFLSCTSLIRMRTRVSYPRGSQIFGPVAADKWTPCGQAQDSAGVTCMAAVWPEISNPNCFRCILKKAPNSFIFSQINKTRPIRGSRYSQHLADKHRKRLRACENWRRHCGSCSVGSFVRTWHFLITSKEHHPILFFFLNSWLILVRVQFNAKFVPLLQ